MRKSLGWTVAILALIAIAVTLACSGKYSAQNNGLVVVPSRADNVVQTFSLNLSNGSTTQINNPGFPYQNGFLSSVTLHPTASVAYVLILQDTSASGSVECQNSTQPATACIAVSQIASDGKLEAPTLVSLNKETVTVPTACNGNTTEAIGVQPVALAIDSGGKYLFVADSGASDGCGNPTPGAVSVFSIDSAGSLTEISGSPFVLPVGGITKSPPNPCTALAICSSASALAVTPTVYPNEYAVCAQQAAPTSEYLYVTDSVNYVVWRYTVNSSTGALAPPTTNNFSVPTGTVPDGVAVDPCNRFLYVANSVSNNVSAYTICSTTSISSDCTTADFSLHPVANSPFSTGYAPGPLTVDAYANFLYVVATGSNYINAFRMSSSTGALTPLAPPTFALSTALGQSTGANAIAIRNDDSFLFVSNSTPSTLSEFGVVPSTGGLSPITPISTFNTPSGVAVK